ncbi:hypothetical protein Tco_1404087 [Tanacetum coccineum]
MRNCMITVQESIIRFLYKDFILMVSAIRKKQMLQEVMVGLEYEMQQDRESLEAISMITRNSRAFDYSVGVTAICGLDSYLNNPFWRRGFGLDKWVMSASVRQESEDWKI